MCESGICDICEEQSDDLQPVDGWRLYGKLLCPQCRSEHCPGCGCKSDGMCPESEEIEAENERINEQDRILEDRLCNGR
jgi:hypothetical protein